MIRRRHVYKAFMADVMADVMADGLIRQFGL